MTWDDNIGPLFTYTNLETKIIIFHLLLLLKKKISSNSFEYQQKAHLALIEHIGLT